MTVVTRIAAGDRGARPSWRELWAYRDLLVLLVRRDFVSKYQQTALGPLWFVLQPLVMTVVFTAVFARVGKLPTDGLPAPLFYMAGLLGWNYVSTTFVAVANTFVANMHIFSKVYFPRLIIPISLAVSNVLTFGVQFATFCALYVYFSTGHGQSFGPTFAIIGLPLVLLQSMALSLGIGLSIAALTVKYRDIIQTLGIVSQVWLYVTPIIYPLSEVPRGYWWFAILNPMTGIVESFRYALLGKGGMEVAATATSVGLTLAILIVGWALFTKAERTVVDFV